MESSNSSKCIPKFLQFRACLIFFAIFKIQSIVINTKSGPVKSFETQSEDISIYTFKNIPFAKQPVGDLRFELPQPTEPWTSENELSPQKISCPQYPYYSGQQLHNSAFGQEDCLVLDVHMRKRDLLQLSSVPVLVYFHGGRFSHGSKEEYGGEFLLRFNDIIVVIPNYRLGILGFLSAQDSVLEGNFGLWDQRAALLWVSENIASFGGDPARVTCAGHDAGGSSVGLHILSSHSQGYFTSAISGSGTALDPWIQNKDPVSAMKKVANGLKCPHNSTNDLLNCLKRRPWRDILKIQKWLKEVPFLPTINTAAENAFLTDHPDKLYSSNNWNIVNYMAGVTEDESSVEVAHVFDASLKYQHMDKIVMYFLQPYLHDVPNLEAIAVAAKYHYFRGSLIPTFASIEPQIVNLMSDFLYKSSLHRTLKLHSQRTSKTFMYVFEYESENQTLGQLFGPKYRHENYGVSHMEDVIYLFNTSFAPWTGTDSDAKTKDMIKMMCRIWGNFIKTGNPGMKWKAFSMDNQWYYMEISDTLQMKSQYRRNDMELWTLLIPDLINIKNSSTDKSPHIQEADSDINSFSWGIAGLSILLGVLCVVLVGVVIITKRRLTQSSLIKVSSSKDEVKYRSI